MASEIIDFRSERQRHEKLLGRKELLEELDRHLAARSFARGWVLLKGSPGMGKSALLSHYLTRLEELKQPVAYHFIRRGLDDWDRPEVVCRNLAAQVEARFPAQAQPGARPETRLRQVLHHVSEEELVPTGTRLFLVVDGLDEAAMNGSGHNPLQRFLPHDLPLGVHVLCASRPEYPHLEWLEAREGLHRIDLDAGRWKSSNDEVVRHYWAHVASSFQPSLDPSFLVVVR
ncbi:ATP-binding protein [Myxococcus sp. AM001]|nr:ATP-binding protein [Myxococcus sp. AM001]